MFGAILAILYLNIKSKKENRADETNEIANLNAEIIRLKDSLNSTINTSLSSMSTSFNSLSTGVTKDMTEALTKVDEKVCLLYTSPSPRDNRTSRMPSSA